MPNIVRPPPDATKGCTVGCVEYYDEQNGTSLDGIRNAGKRAREPVNQILNFARRHDGQRQTVNVAGAVEQAMSLLRASP